MLMHRFRLRAYHPDFGIVDSTTNHDWFAKREFYPVCLEVGFSGYSQIKSDWIIMACTGLRDAFGTLVFEGDILDDMSGDKFLICWDGAAAGFFKKPIGDKCGSRKTGLQMVSTYYRVIGHIHEQRDNRTYFNHMNANI